MAAIERSSLRSSGAPVVADSGTPECLVVSEGVRSSVAGGNSVAGSSAVLECWDMGLRSETGRFGSGAQLQALDMDWRWAGAVPRSVVGSSVGSCYVRWSQVVVRSCFGRLEGNRAVGSGDIGPVGTSWPGAGTG